MSQVFEFLKGSKQGEVKTGSLQDPFQKHDPLLVEKVPACDFESAWDQPRKTWRRNPDLRKHLYFCWDRK